MSSFFAFLLGVAVAGVALPVVRGIRGKVECMRSTATLEDNLVTTVSQVLHLAIQGSPTGITVLDRSGEVLLSNARAHEMSLVRDRDVNEDVWSVALEVFEDKETRTLDLSLPQRRTGNPVSSVRAVVKPLTLVDDRFVIVYGSDESENVRMEAARRDFVANVSHELKTPVGGMALLAEALMEGVDDPEHVEYFGRKLHREAHRMAAMINELISLSKLQGAEALPELEPVSLDEVIREAIARNQVAADTAGIRLTSGPPSKQFVLGDRSLLVTAVSNLISNAINYSPQALPVSVSTKRKVDSNGDVVLIRVTDRGIGIAEEDQARVFERFFRVDKARSRSTGGTGLGLAIVKHVVANHNGNIKLWSRVGTGSTFTIELPIYHAEPAGPEAPPSHQGEDAEQSTALRKAVTRVATRRKDKAS